MHVQHWPAGARPSLVCDLGGVCLLCWSSGGQLACPSLLRRTPQTALARMASPLQAALSAQHLHDIALVRGVVGAGSAEHLAGAVPNLDDHWQVKLSR